MNNRNCKPKVSLRMADGGVWGAVKGVFSSAPQETMTQKFARQDAERAAKAAKAAPAAPAVSTPAAAPAGAGIGGYAADAALKEREAKAMKAAGLRDGGEVPGSGRGDKVPALYEPGEFVVSNAMLKKAPGLRDQLHNLRAEALAEQGKSVEEADAQAYDDGSEGEHHEQENSRVPAYAARHTAGEQTVEGVRPGMGRGDGGGPTGVSGRTRVSLRALDGFSVDERPWNGARDARLFASQPGPGNPNVGPGGSVQAQAFRLGSAPAPAPAPAPTISAPANIAARSPGVWGGLKNAAGAVGQGAKGIATGSILDTNVGAVARGTLRGGSALMSGVGRVAAPLALGASAMQTASTDTQDYAARMGTTAGDSFGKDLGLRAVGALADLGDTVTGGHATKLGNWIAGNGYESGNPQPAGSPSLRTPTPTSAPAYTGLMGPQINPDAPSLRGRSGADVAGAPGVSKFTENGRTLYSNVAGDNADMMDKKLVGIVPGMPQAQIDRVLTNPDGSRWSAADNAVMAANLRDGIDPYRGTSRQKGEDEAAQIKGMRELAFSKQGTPGRLGAMKMFSEQQNQQTLRQGQDLQYKAATYGHELNAETARANARYQALKDQRDFAAGRYDKGLEQSAKMDEQGRAVFKNKFDTLDKDGKPIARPDMEAAANELVMRQNPNWSQLPQSERAQLQSDAFDHISLVGNLRDHQNNSIWQTLGLKNPDVRADRMPNLAGAKLEETGFVEGKLTPNAGTGDYKLTTKDGKTMFLGRDKVSEDQLSYLKRAGVTFGSK